MSDADEIWNLIDRSNSAWLSGSPSDTAELFAEKAVLVAPGLAAELSGREAVVQTYVDATESTTTETFQVTERSLLVDGDTAIAAYVFEVSYVYEDTRHEERGQEILVLRRFDDRWQAIWRTQVPLPRSSE